jgi:O-antigen ligase
MHLVVFFGHLIAVLIRPQDWKDSFFTGYSIVFFTATLTLLVGLLYWFNKKHRVAFHHTWFVVAFLLLVVISNLVNGNVALGIEMFIYYFKACAIYFMVLFLLDDVSKIKKAVLMFVVIIVFIAIQAEYQYRYGVNIAGHTTLAGYSDTRVTWTGMFDGPNGLCLVFIVALAFSLEMVFGPDAFPMKMLGVLFSVILLNGIYLTNSRGGLISLLAMGSVYLFNKLRGSLRSRIFRMALIGICVGLVLIRISPSRMKSIDLEEESAAEHKWIWEQALVEFRQNPVLGVGKGNSRVQTVDGTLIRAHSNILQNASEMGFVGVFIYVGMIYCCFKGLIMVLKLKEREREDQNRKSLSVATCSALAGFCTGTNFITFEVDPLFFYCGLSAVLLRDTLSKGFELGKFLFLRDIFLIFSIGIILVSTLYIVVIFYI